MPESRKIELEVNELPLYPEREDTIFVPERPIEAVARHLNEQHLSMARAAEILYVDYGKLSNILEEENK